MTAARRTDRLATRAPGYADQVARNGGSRRDAGSRRPGARTGSGAKAGSTAKKGSTKGQAPRAAKKARPTPEPETPTLPPGPFRLGAIPGATPGTWMDRWQERLPGIPIELVPLEVRTQRATLVEGAVDAAIVRLPIDRAGLHVIALYDETPVVVCGAESHLTAADDLGLEDLAGEIVIVPRDDVLGIDVPGSITPSFAAPEDTELAIETVAAGVGIVIVPMSLARLHQRRDVAHRVLRDGPLSPVAIAWRANSEDAPHAPLVDAFVGIVRGRTANSSRG